MLQPDTLCCQGTFYMIPNNALNNYCNTITAVYLRASNMAISCNFTRDRCLVVWRKHTEIALNETICLHRLYLENGNLNLIINVFFDKRSNL